MRSIQARLFAAIGGLFAGIVLTAAVGGYASRTSNAGMETIYADRVVPLRDLKVVADMYAVNIVDASHKVRNGNLTWPEGRQAVEEAGSRIKAKWAAYAGTYMDEHEKRRAIEAQAAMSLADKAMTDLLGILQRNDRPALDAFVKDSLYQSIDPVSEAISKLVDLQIEVAEVVHGRSGAAYDLARKIGVGTLIIALAALVFALSTTLNGVVRPLAAITGVMRRIAGGDLELPVPGLGRPDEIGAMAASVEVFRNGLVAKRESDRVLASENEAKMRRAQALDALTKSFEHNVSALTQGLAGAST
ncbi:MCP four helix bundle domain-containing protein, partial [Methylobacterium iners]